MKIWAALFCVSFVGCEVILDQTSLSRKLKKECPKYCTKTGWTGYVKINEESIQCICGENF